VAALAAVPTVAALAYTPEEWSALGSLIQAGATVLTLVVAVSAVHFARRQVKEARAQVDEARLARENAMERDRALKEEQARPFVVVDFEPSLVWGNMINLVFENIGTTLAKRVRFTFEPPLKSTRHSEDGYDFYASSLFTKGIPAMPPGKRVSALFDLSHERIGSGLPMTYRVKVEMQDALDREQEPLEYDLDLNFHYGLRRVAIKTVHDAAKALHSMERLMSSWTQHSSGLRVWNRDEDAYLAAEQREYEQWMEEQRQAEEEGRGRNGSTEP
jgi:hypothetical protein